MNHLSMSVTFKTRNVFKIIYVDAQFFRLGWASNVDLLHILKLYVYSSDYFSVTIAATKRSLSVLHLRTLLHCACSSRTSARSISIDQREEDGGGWGSRRKIDHRNTRLDLFIHVRGTLFVTAASRAVWPGCGETVPRGNSTASFCWKWRFCALNKKNEPAPKTTRRQKHDCLDGPPSCFFRSSRHAKLIPDNKAARMEEL